MSLRSAILEAFVHRPLPNSVVEIVRNHDADQIDAQWFEGRHWQSISRLDWEQHRGAFYAFSPEAFRFYLPSILLISTGDAGQSFDLAHAVIDVLDRSPDPGYWDEFMRSRFSGFTSCEYRAIQDWLLALAADAGGDSSESLGRCFDTVVLLEKQSLANAQPLPKSAPQIDTE